jgi:hypothetical protein
MALRGDGVYLRVTRTLLAALLGRARRRHRVLVVRAVTSLGRRVRGLGKEPRA